jgi:hypothetical protein
LNTLFHQVNAGDNSVVFEIGAVDLYALGRIIGGFAESKTGLFADVIIDAARKRTDESGAGFGRQALTG